MNVEVEATRARKKKQNACKTVSSKYLFWLLIIVTFTLIQCISPR